MTGQTPTAVRRLAVVGTGVIGAGWAARAPARGLVDRPRGALYLLEHS